MNAPSENSNSKDDKSVPAGDDLGQELESLSLQVSAQLSMGSIPNMDAILAQVPKERRAAFLKRLDSMAAGFITPPSLAEHSMGGETIGFSPEQSFVDSAPATGNTDSAATQHFGESRLTNRQLGHYQLQGELGRGGMGIVYRAKHIERGDLVALKILPRVNGDSLHRFKREFRSLADISHPNLVGLRTLESDGERWFFTMELVEGAKSFQRYVCPNQNLDTGRLSSAALQLCEGIQKLHTLSDCLVENGETIRSSIEHQDMRSNCCAYLQTRASEGRFNLDVVLEKMPTNDEDILSTCNLDKARGIRHLYLKRNDEAIKSFERALARPRAALIPNWHVSAGIPFLVQALRLSACALQQSNPTEARARRKRALRLARRGVWICWLFPPEYAFALREYGEVLRGFGKLDKAEKYLRKSCEVSRKYETPYELAKSELSLAEIAVQRGAPGSDEALAAARQRVEAFQSQIGDATRESEKLLAAFCDSLP